MIWVEQGLWGRAYYWVLKHDGKELATIKQLGDRYFIDVPGVRLYRLTGSKDLDTAKRDAETIVTARQTMVHAQTKTEDK